MGESGRGVPSGLVGLGGGVDSRVLRGEFIVGSGKIFGWDGFKTGSSVWVFFLLGWLGGIVGLWFSGVLYTP